MERRGAEWRQWARNKVAVAVCRLAALMARRAVCSPDWRGASITHRVTLMSMRRQWCHRHVLQRRRGWHCALSACSTVTLSLLVYGSSCTSTCSGSASGVARCDVVGKQTSYLLIGDALLLHGDGGRRWWDVCAEMTHVTRTLINSTNARYRSILYSTARI